MLLIQMAGLSGAGKSTLAAAVKEKLTQLHFRVEIIDGDEYRKTLCKDLGYSKEDRIENIRRLGSIAIKNTRQGIISILSAINPYEEARAKLREAGSFVKTVWVNCSLDTLLLRDTKGLYGKALLPDHHPLKIHNLTGINDPFEVPVNPDLVIHTHKETVEQSSSKLFYFILLSMKGLQKQSGNEMKFDATTPRSEGLL